MSLKEFNKAFGTETNLEEERKHFVARINQSIFLVLHKDFTGSYREELFRGVCYGLGVDPNPLISKANAMTFDVYSKIIPSYQTLTGNDFMETLKVLVIMRRQLKLQQYVKLLDHYIDIALAASVIDIGVRWKDGMFYPSGAKELDEKLIEDNLEWLRMFPDVQDKFSIALRHFNLSLEDPAARKDSVTNSYTSIELLSREILGNKKNFDANSSEIVAFLKLPREYGNILHYYKEIANEYSSRHAGSDFSHVEAEAFVYMTGLLMRLILEKKLAPGRDGSFDFQNRP